MSAILMCDLHFFELEWIFVVVVVHIVRRRTECAFVDVFKVLGTNENRNRRRMLISEIGIIRRVALIAGRPWRQLIRTMGGISVLGVVGWKVGLMPGGDASLCRALGFCK